MITRRSFLRGAAVLGASGLGTGLYTWRVEPHWVEFVRRSLPIPGLPPALQGATLVQVSDLHVGPRVDEDYLIDTLRKVAEVQPDIVAITGDFVSYQSAREERDLDRVLAALPHGRLATLASLGNHDSGPGWAFPEIADRIARVVAGRGIQILRNELTVVAGLQFAGLEDIWTPTWEPEPVLRSLDPALPTVVLSHNPDAVDLPVWQGFRGWILAGHTHGGQCKPPFLPPPILPVRNKRYTQGEIDLGDGRRLYINRGLGHLIQVRFNVRPEVTVFTLSEAVLSEWSARGAAFA
ncbi:MAG TPA: metallophosphoesterase [Thermoanaerobaculia bacterium]|nr:metallophosphoesterase [Thermoanaerobaculia bacterium]